MPWPFSGSSNASAQPRKDDDRRDDNHGSSSTRAPPTPTGTWLKELGIDPDWAHYKDAKNWLPTIGATAAVLAAAALYRRYLRRIPGTAYIQPSAFRTRSVFGQVTSVGDGDGFHLFHTPGGRLAGWGWLRSVPKDKAQLKGKTIPVRIAGIDAPEGAHFGRPAQPFAAEALQWLTDYVRGRRVRAHIHRRDQYDRVVATVTTRRWGGLLRRDVGLEMLKRGLATTYEAKTGAEFGGLEARYRAAEARAKARERGMWGIRPAQFESPRAYKRRMAAGEGGKGNGDA